LLVEEGEGRRRKSGTPRTGDKFSILHQTPPPPPPNTRDPKIPHPFDYQPNTSQAPGDLPPITTEEITSKYSKKFLHVPPALRFNTNVKVIARFTEISISRQEHVCFQRVLLVIKVIYLRGKSSRL
jgi:hypothetical protein